jgi:hypothetical protein
LARFERVGWHNTSPRHAAFHKPQPDGLVTERQQTKIRELMRALGWDDNAARLAGFAQKVIWRPWPQTRAEGSS